MCGINGIIINTNNETLSTKIGRMNDRIIHRGPDDDGVFHESNDFGSIAFGMRRLAVIDLSTGNQPMFSDDKKIVIVFNGEIYNFPELRKELIDEGVVFRTHSDTEVILRMYDKYGVASFSRLDGMFAFSIYDKKINKVIIARDFFGEKPLYYTRKENKIIWASELKSLIIEYGSRPEISREGLNLYFRLTYIPAPYTIYEGIHKLEANHYMEINPKNLDIQIHPISVEKFSGEKRNISFEEAKKRTQELVSESVRSRMISDVPFGAFLSGGVDSSIVALEMSRHAERKVETFSIGFEKKSFDESDKARTVAKMIGSNHHEFILKPQDLRNDTDRILLNFDEPFADSSALPSYFVALKTRQHVTVALTGDGGDEMYGGYNKYLVGKYNSKMTAVLPKPLFSLIKSAAGKLLRTSDDDRGLKFKALKMINAVDYGDDYYYNMISLGYTDRALMTVLNPGFYKKSIFDYYKNLTGQRSKTLSDFRAIDKLISLEGDMLVKVDRTSMLTSLECRAPFLNRKIWEYNNTLPEKYLLNGNSKKYLLKESFKEHFPDRFLDLSKKGFGVPVGDWLREHLKEELLSYTDDTFLREQGIFNTTEIETLVRDHISGKFDRTFQVWTYFCFQKWYRNTYLNIF
ncbi:asparagine synthase (glutamine-hydrolyzing) [Kaistella sp. PBT33-4]|uniref:asparagine synthase (glutamine-hydrolyzing) n=1 Tax=Kaistella sp. PBT33-4 TaxID=3032000 RepID=UPI0023D87955|nr:asparagine synthase (glutamine-hydrolyzing) [Kaistella sp. PBT33-4]MDF0718788.1 asparagine synthase (glutamine-hydrolyzing) [Kaistella sp. PBT33-4]